MIGCLLRRGAVVPRRYVALDGVRGILAIAVVIHHYAQLYHSDWMGKAWVSVDAFFILSGFVVFHSYAGKIQSGMSFSQFAKSRLKRLYPMYFIGLCIGLLGLFVEMGSEGVRVWDIAWATLSGIFIFPYFNHSVWPAAGVNYSGDLFPLNPPAWSLFFELFVNAVFFFWFVKFKKISAALVCVAVFPVYMWFLHVYGVHSGWGTDNFFGGIPRVMLYFFIGCLIYKAHFKLPEQAVYKPVILLVLAMVGFSFRSNIITYSLLFVFLPLIILLSSRVAVCEDSSVGRGLTWLGGLSYPLYITHYPLVRFLYPVTHEIGLGDELNIVLSTIFAIAVAIPLMKFEPALRKILTMRLFPSFKRV